MIDTTKNPPATHARDFATVKEAARGQWDSILAALGVPESALTGKHGPCHGCGGKNRFRWINDLNDGGFICNGGGNLTGGDGFALLQHVFGWSAAEALRAVADYLGITSNPSPETARRIQAVKHRQKLADLDRMIHHEAHILLQVVGNRLASWELANDHKFRNARPEWRPMPDAPLEREALAARRLVKMLGLRYG